MIKLTGQKINTVQQLAIMKTFECLKCSALWSHRDWELKIAIGESLDELTKLYFHILSSIINRVMQIETL